MPAIIACPHPATLERTFQRGSAAAGADASAEGVRAVSVRAVPPLEGGLSDRGSQLLAELGSVLECAWRQGLPVGSNSSHELRGRICEPRLVGPIRVHGVD